MEATTELGEGLPDRVDCRCREVLEVSTGFMVMPEGGEPPSAVDRGVHLTNARDAGLVGARVQGRTGNQEDSRDEDGAEEILQPGSSRRPRNRSPDPCSALLEYAGRLSGSSRRTPQPQLPTRAEAPPAPRPPLPGAERPARRPGGTRIRRRHHRPVRPLAGLAATARRVGAAEAEPAEQFGSLARHLLARYDVPAFLDAAWRDGLTAEGVRHQGWFKHVGRGENIRTADDLPIPMTKRMAHHFLQTPQVSASWRRSGMPRSSAWAATSGSPARSSRPGSGPTSIATSSGCR